MQYGVRSIHAEEDVTDFLDARIYDRQNTEILVLCDASSLKTLITEVRIIMIFIEFFRNYHNTKLSHFVSSIFSLLMHEH